MTLIWNFLNKKTFLFLKTLTSVEEMSLKLSELQLLLWIIFLGITAVLETRPRREKQKKRDGKIVALQTITRPEKSHRSSHHNI